MFRLGRLLRRGYDDWPGSLFPHGPRNQHAHHPHLRLVLYLDRHHDADLDVTFFRLVRPDHWPRRLRGRADSRRDRLTLCHGRRTYHRLLHYTLWGDLMHGLHVVRSQCVSR